MNLSAHKERRSCNAAQPVVFLASGEALYYELNSRVPHLHGPFLNSFIPNCSPFSEGLPHLIRLSPWAYKTWTGPH